MYQVRVRSTDAGVTNAAPIGYTNVKAPKNGYVYIYVSNRSNEDVYFDNLTVNITTGNVIEEDHYYSYGLKIAGISSVKLADASEGVIANKYLYNEKELFDDGGLNWYDYGFRNYDPQIGRFTQLDPLTFEYPELTPYQFAGDDPIANVDLDGLEQLGTTVAKSILSTADNPKILTTVLVTAKPAITAASVTKSFFSGIWESAVSTLKGVVDVVSHPIRTATALVNVITHPIQTAKALGKMVNQAYHTFVNGDANTKAKMLGHAGCDIAQLFLGVGEEKVAVEVTEDAEKVSEVAKGVEEAEDLGKVSEGTVEGTETVSPKFENLPSQNHHLIPNQIYKEFKNELDELDWIQNEEENLMKLPTPFHGNHPSYSNFVRQEMQKIMEKSSNKIKDLKQLQTDLRGLINNVHKSGKFERLNSYFKALGY